MDLYRLAHILSKYVTVIELAGYPGITLTEVITNTMNDDAIYTTSITQANYNISYVYRTKESTTDTRNS
jgi:hypothetical protein